jgi:hypothetical protein
MDDPHNPTEELMMKLCIELIELAESYKSDPTPDILERIKLKEQLINALTEFSKSIPRHES